MKASRGFTLIEILVVVVIISLLASLAVLTIGSDPDRQLKHEAQRTMSVLQLAADEALVQGRDLGVVITENGYQIVQFIDQNREWAALDTPAFSPYTLPESFELSLQSEGNQVDLTQIFGEKEKGASSIKPALLFLSSGETTPFILQFNSPDQGSGYRLLSNGLGEIILERQNG